jgi:ribosomal protein S12 methylthiotransferase
MNYFLLTLGCAKNVADSDGIGSILDEYGHAPVEDSNDADVLIVNTCGFLQASRKESLATLRELGEQKREGQVLIAAGCLISRYGAQVQKEVPQVDGVIDAGKWLALPRFIHFLQSRDDAPEDWLTSAYAGLPIEQLAARSIVEPLPHVATGPSAYLKIADGCDRPCAFCIIPAIKGSHRSKSEDAVIAEARELVSQGVQEIVLVAQDTTAYGWDWGKRDALAPLLARLCEEVEGLSWLRLMYAYPGHVTPRLIETMARYPQIVHYLDIPLQHAHPETLKRMKRPNAPISQQMIADLRAAMPDFAIRTTFITGFPGETDEEFAGLLDFLQTHQFDRVGVFEYSREEGTPAASFENQVPAKIKKRRRDQAMALQQKISFEKNQTYIGKTMNVLIEGTGDGVSVGRTYRDAPEVDGVVIIQKELTPGEFARVKITGAMEYDLTGVVVK